MKLLVLCFCFTIIGFAAAKPANERGCIWILGRCSSQCPEGTHGYGVGCGYVTPEATCENPEPVEDTRGKICDYSACYCDSPTVRDKAANKCVPLEECPKNE